MEARRKRRIVAGEQHRAAGRLALLHQKIHKAQAGTGVERRRRLIGDHQRRGADQRPSRRHALLLPDAEFRDAPLFDFGVAQSDWQYHAYNGTSKFKKAGAFKDLRAVFSVHPEPVTILARDGTGIKNVTDLKGKRVAGILSGRNLTSEHLDIILGGGTPRP
jgi:hypothetical protein